MTRNLLVFLMVVLVATPALAVTGKSHKVAALWSKWGAGAWSVCGDHALVGTAECIGETKDCTTKKMYARNKSRTDEYAVQMMVAVDITEHGAYFCPIQIEGKNEDRGYAWTEYAMIGGITGCRWLCKDGYSGDDCSVAPGSTAKCDTAEFRRANYDGLKRVKSGTNIEDGIAMFSWDIDDHCGLLRGQQHDVILAITRWAPGGHGAWVRHVVVRAQRERFKDMISWPSIYYPVGATEILACISGYKPNAGGTDCVAINENLCAEAKSCPGWTGFEESQHTFVMPTGKNCFEFRCKGENMAFASATDRSCVECTTSLHSGMSPVDGTCVKCDSGKVFNNKATSAAGHCVDAIAYTKTDMQYGKGQTKNSNPKITNQCWTKTETDVYRECVTSGAKNASGSLKVKIDKTDVDVMSSAPNVSAF